MGSKNIKIYVIEQGFSHTDQKASLHEIHFFTIFRIPMPAVTYFNRLK